MKKLLLGVLLLLSTLGFGQTISEKPIYVGEHGVLIQKLGNTGAISFLYQDSDYQSIVVITSFWVGSKSKAIEMVDKALFILNMDKTDKDQNINYGLGNIQFNRYGFSQEVIYVSGKTINL